jgi:hypothetical protein
MNGFALRGINHDNTGGKKGLGALRRAFVVGEIAKVDSELMN